MGKASILYLPYQFKVLFLQSFRHLPRPGAYNCVPCGEGMTCPALSQLVTGRWISKVNSPRLNSQNPENWLEEVFFMGDFLEEVHILILKHLPTRASTSDWRPKRMTIFWSELPFSKKYDTKRPSWSCREMGGNFSQLEVDLERGASDVGEEFVPQINSGYFSTKNAPTEVWGWWMLRLWPRKNHQWLGGCF